MFTYSQWLVDFLAKAAGHKYIKRIPYTSGGKMRYRYIYKVTHMAGGKHVLDPEHMVVGAAFQMETGAGKEVHAHIVSTSGENVTYKLDDGPDKDKVFTVTRAQLAQKLDEKHGARAALRAERDKQSKVVEDLKAGGASTKQVAREQARLERLEAALPAPATEESATSRLRARAARVLASQGTDTPPPPAPAQTPVATTEESARAARVLASQGTDTPLSPTPASAPKGEGPSTAEVLAALHRLFGAKVPSPKSEEPKVSKPSPATVPPPVQANGDSVYSALKVPDASTPEAVAQYTAVMGYRPPTADELKTYILGKSAPKSEMRDALVERAESEGESLETARFRAILGDRAQLLMREKRVRMYPELSTESVYIIYGDSEFRALFVDGPHKGRTFKICSSVQNKNYIATVLRDARIKDVLRSADLKDFGGVKDALSDIISATGAVASDPSHPRYNEATAKGVQSIKTILGAFQNTPDVVTTQGGQAPAPRTVESWESAPAPLQDLSERILSRRSSSGYRVPYTATGQAQGYLYTSNRYHTVYVPTTSTKTSYKDKGDKKETKGVAVDVDPRIIDRGPAMFSISKEAHAQLAKLLELVPDEAESDVYVSVENGRATFSLRGGRTLLTVEGVPRSSLLRTTVDTVTLRDAVCADTGGISFHRVVKGYDTHLQASTPRAIHMLKQTS